MLQVWGRISSINVRKVMWTVQHLGLAAERIDAGAQFGVVKAPHYLAMNPNALVPTFVDGDTVLWESNVIVRYLSAKHAAGDLNPLDLAQRFEAEKWMDWQQTTLNPAGRNAFVQWCRTPEEQRQPELIAQSTQATEPLMAMLDAHLARQPFMAGEHLTMADIPIACEIHRWWGLPQPRPERPHLARWYAGMLARPASVGVLDIALS